MAQGSSYVQFNFDHKHSQDSAREKNKQSGAG